MHTRTEAHKYIRPIVFNIGLNRTERLVELIQWRLVIGWQNLENCYTTKKKSDEPIQIEKN